MTDSAAQKTEKDQKRAGLDDDASTWEEAVAAGWKRTADRWDPETMTLRPEAVIQPAQTGDIR